MHFLKIFNSKCLGYSRDGFFTVLIIETARYFLNSLLILCVESVYLDKQNYAWNDKILNSLLILCVALVYLDTQNFAWNGKISTDFT